MKRYKGILNIFVGCTLGLCILFLCIHEAENKYFWTDEGHEITDIYQKPFLDIIQGKIDQPNKNPIYYLLQRAVVGNEMRFNADILVEYRTISLVSAFILVLLLYFFISKHLGMFWGILSVVALASQRLFYQYSAESRHYSLWLLFFLILLVATTNMCMSSWDNIKRKQKFFYILSLLGITLVISMGVIQALVSILLCLGFWTVIHSRPKNIKFFTHFALPLGLLCVGIELFYGLQGVDANTDHIINTQFDLFHTLRQGDLRLLKMPGRLLLPKPTRDAFLGVHLLNLLVIFGVGACGFYWKKGRDLKDKDLFVYTLNAITVVQAVLSTILIGSVIGILQYWFVQRIFLYLIVCHAVLAVTGGYFILLVTKDYFQKRNFSMAGVFGPKNSAVFATCILFILIFLSVKYQVKHIFTFAQNQDPSSCLAIPGKLPNDFNSKNSLPHDKGLNFIAKVGKYIDTCSRNGNEKDRVVYLWHKSNEWFLTPEIPADGELFNISAKKGIQYFLGKTSYFKL